MDALKNNGENYPRKCFRIKEKETRVKFNPRLSANRPSNNWALENRETNVTASSGEAERKVNEIMENKHREPIVVFIGHSDCEELTKDESSELPKCFWRKYFI